MQTNPCATNPKLFALEVAEAFLAGRPSDDQEAQLVNETALLVGQHLSDLGQPGAWMHIDIERFFAQLRFSSEDELVPICLTLIALYGWLGSIAILPWQSCKLVLSEIERCAPDLGYIRALVQRGQTLLDTADLALADTVPTV